MAKRRRRLELSYKKDSDRLAAYERKRKSSGAEKRIMFVGDRGTDDLVGSGNSSDMTAIHQHCSLNLWLLSMAKYSEQLVHFFA
ncbi:hypothetical protein BD408DRAFT_425961 [Parasitella parasitica]|nr:hypothetical protein BD408DRAFT_425961 [Parasitella parasitica]